MKNITSCAAVGAPIMMGKKNGCLKLMTDALGLVPVRLSKQWSGCATVDEIAFESADCRLTYTMANCPQREVAVEPLNKSTMPPQCYHSQEFFHHSRFYARAPKCLKCSGGHLTSECTKSAKVPAKCANCSGPHPANFSGCPKNPINTKPNKNKPTKNVWQERAAARKENKKTANTFLRATNLEKDGLKLVAEKLKLTVPDNAKVLDLNILIESSQVYKKETELVKNIIDYAVEETRIKKSARELNLELEKIKLAHKRSE
ncbi:UNVERIFIED_CONTAM: Nucleic-acid-binding protein from transposon X-element [Trichonephila clavipes]